MTRLLLRLSLVLLLYPGVHSALAQKPRPTASRPAPARPSVPRRPLITSAPRPTPVPRQPMRKAAELISRQAPININNGLYDSLTPDQARVVVSLSKQRAYLLRGDDIAIDSPISSGKRAGMTPSGKFSVMEKDKDHRSSVYGDFKDRSGRTVRGGVSLRIDSAPSGTHYVGASMKWFMRLTGDGVGMHVGFLPGYPASHGCIRMPPQAAEMFYNRVKVGTPVEVAP
ncbi:MAG TPA: L,D-transpeptidase family protein [Chthoniobacterales bacterium]|nr:L,D-transpeptidase family protein [Chthoniobacterales bacterium]